jgi:hypothetical protein
VCVGVIVGGKKEYAIGSANLLMTMAAMMNTAEKNTILHPETIRSRRIRKNFNVRALRIERVPVHNPVTANSDKSATMVITAVWISSFIRVTSSGFLPPQDYVIHLIHQSLHQLYHLDSKG